MGLALMIAQTASKAGIETDIPAVSTYLPRVSGCAQKKPFFWLNNHK
jgi:hypothetical protein